MFCWRSESGKANRRLRVDKDSLGQHHIPVKLNFMSPQTVQPLQSHSCSFQHLDMTFPNLLLLFPVFNHVSHHLLIGRACCPRCCSQIWEGQHSPQREVPQTSYIFKKKKNVLLSCSSPCFSPSPPSLAGRYWFGQLFAHFACMFCSRMALSDINKG